MRQRCIVKIQYGSYTGEEMVYCDENDETETIIEKAFKQANCNFLSMAYKNGKVITREYVE